MPARLASAEFFAIRSPLLAFDELLRWTEGGWRTAAGDPLFDQRFEEARSALRRRLREVLSRQEVRDALLLSSHQLGEKLSDWLEEPDSQLSDEIEVALSQHLMRLATEVDCGDLQMAPTVGSIAGATSLRVGVGSSRQAQIDIACLAELAQTAARQPSLQRKLSFFTNSSLYCTHGKVRFLTSRSAEMRREYRATTAELTPHLDAIVQRAQDGATLEELVSVILTIDPEVSRKEAESYLGELIEEQVLVPELFPKLTGENAFRDLAEALASSPESKLVRPLGPTAPVARVQIRRSGATPLLSPGVVEELLRGAELLCQLAPPNDRIRRFTESFVARYGDEIVSLVEALDEQYGIGFEGWTTPEPLLEGLAFPSSTQPTRSLGARERFLLRKLEEAWRTGSEQISPNSEEVAAIGGGDALPLPNSFAVCGALFAATEEAIDRGEYFFRLDRVSGPSAVAALAGFCDADRYLLERVTRHFRAEESLEPKRTFAEVVCFPYLGHSSADSEHRIPITDLRLSVVGERLRLTSERLGCELVPRLTAPYDFIDPRNPPIYRFLCALQNQGTAAELQWNWGALGGAAFLPRVVSGRLVLSPARWLLDEKTLQGIADSSASERFRALCRARERLHLPRFVEAGTAADHSVFDLENVLSAECLVQKLKVQAATPLLETFAAPEMLCSSGPQGRYMHELIVPFIRESNAAPPSARAPHLGVQRSFLPGSEWLQVNLYSSSGVTDQVLREVVAPAIERALSAGIVEGWHFIRYTDPGFHVRLRLHGVPERLMSEVATDIRSLAMSLVEDRRLSALKLDTYLREIGRYGGAEGILAAEKLFHSDSKAVLSILQELSDAELAGVRWQIAFIGIDMLLSDLGLTIEQKKQVLKMARDDIASRLKADANLEAQIVRRYQRESPHLRELLALKPDRASALERGISALRRRSEDLKPCRATLVELERAGRLSRPIVEQAYSYIHMFANRLFASAALAQELVLYDFLHRVHLEP